MYELPFHLNQTNICFPYQGGGGRSTSRSKINLFQTKFNKPCFSYSLSNHFYFYFFINDADRSRSIQIEGKKDRYIQQMYMYIQLIACKGIEIVKILLMNTEQNLSLKPTVCVYCILICKYRCLVYINIDFVQQISCSKQFFLELQFFRYLRTRDIFIAQIDRYIDRKVERQIYR